jgi:hypothetical protein
MRLRTLMLTCAALAAAGAPPARAKVVYSSIPNLDVAENSGGLLCSTCFGVYEPIEKFRLATQRTITGFNLVTGIGPAYGGDGKFTIEIYNAAHDAIVFSQPVVSVPGQQTPDKLNPTHIVSGDLSGLTLGPGTYWFAAVNDQELGLPGFKGDKHHVLITFPHTGVPDPAAHGNFVSLGFQLLTTAVPEPSTWAMLVCGVGGIGALARGRRRRPVG